MTETPEADTLRFISDSVISRLKDGSFVPERRSKAGPMKMKDRRDTISPLAVTKRCVRYDHHVFLNRKNLVIEMAESLNSSDKKLILMGGVQGCGKTSLARGIIELMGGGKEQLLWFDVSAHTDYDEIIVFLIQYITYICSALSIDNNDDGAPSSQEELPEDPFKKLEALILKVAHVPLLIVIDNVEHIVDREYQIRSFPLKETLNFLLSFPNIKMLLCGERLPYADMSANSAVITDIRLSGLPENDVLELLQKQDGKDTETEQQALIDLYRKTQGYPWLLKTIFYLHKQDMGIFSTLSELNSLLSRRDEDNPADALAKFIYDHLTPEEQEVAQVLALVRHPADFETVLALSRYCKPSLAMKTPENFKETLDRSILKPLMKRTFPPQSVLAHIRDRHEPPSNFQPWYEFYRQVKKVISREIPPSERTRVHRLLQDFYLKEKNKAPEERLYNAKSKALIAEAKHHGNASRQRRNVFNDPGSRLGAKAYLYGGIKPAEPVSTPTPPQTAPDPSPIVIQASEPLYTMDELNLTDEEKALLEQGEMFEESEASPDDEQDTEPQTFLDHLDEAARHAEEFEHADKPPQPPDSASSPPITVVIDDTQTPPTDTPTDDDTAVSPKTRAIVSDTLNIEETDPVEKQILQRLAGAVANHNRSGMLTHLLGLARHRGSKGLFKKAEDCLEKALTLQTDAQPSDVAEIYSQLGRIHKETYRHNSALEHLKKALAHYEKLTHPNEEEVREQAHIYQDQGDIYAFRGQHQDAINAYDKGLDHLNRLPGDEGLSDLYFKLAQVYDVTGVPENAINYYEQSLSLDERHHNELSCAATLSNIASLHLESGRLDDALDYFSRSLAYDRRHEFAEGMYKTLDRMAQIRIQQDNWQKAEETYQQAMAIAINEGNNTWKANIYLKLGNLHQALSNWGKALEHFQHAQSAAPVTELSEESQNLLNRKIEEAHRALQQ